MLRVLVCVLAVCMAFPASAQNIAASELDAAARNAKGTSVLFGNRDPREVMRQREEQRRREAYEEQMRREEEARRKAEEARRRALRPVNLFGNGIKIFAEVNGEIITSRDMQDRVNAFVATTQIPVNAETKEMVIEKVLQAAVDEKIKLQEAAANGIEISDADMENGMKNFAKANGVSVSQLKKMLKQAQVDEDVFRSQMKAELAWARLVQRKAAQSSDVSQSEVDDALANITQDIKTPKFMVSEIVIPKKQAAHINDLVGNLRQDPRFELYAMQFSQSPSARGGGHLGWVNKGQLAAPLEKALENMKEGDISNPIPLGSDYYILRLEKKYRPGVDKAPVPDAATVKQMLESKKLEETAAKYLRDLRNKAVIERRA